MPVRRSAPQPRPGRRRIPTALAVALTAVAVATAAAALPVDAAEAAAGTAAVGTAAVGTAADGTAADGTAAVGPEPSTVTGVVERVSVETTAQTARIAPTGPARPTASAKGTNTANTATITSWVRSGDNHVQVQSSALEAIPTGATVTVRLDPSHPVTAAAAGLPPSPRTARAVRAVTVRSVPKVAATKPASTGPQSVTLVLALPHGAKADGTSAAALAGAVNTGVARFWSQQSGGRISFSVTRTSGWTALTHSCSDIWGLWDEARARSGFVPGARRHLVVYVPPGAGCPTGLGTVGDRIDAGGNVLVGGSTVGLLAHELGHNLGLGHSNALHCTAAQDGTFTGSGYGTACQSVEYGDWYDVMGISWDNLGTLSTGQAYRLGLLGAADVRTVTSPTRVVLRAVSGHTGLQSLRVHDPAGATYVIEYRPAAGADAWLDTPADWRGLRSGVLIRRVDPADPTQTLLLDPSPAGAPPATTTPGTPADPSTPSTPAQAADDDWNLVLSAGQTLTTASGRVGIMLEATTPSTAVIAVQFDGSWPSALAVPGGRLLNGAQVTVGEAPAAWLAAASS